MIWQDISLWLGRLLGLYFHSSLARENKLACSVKYFTISHSDSCNHIVLSHGCIDKLITLVVVVTWARLTSLRVFTVTYSRRVKYLAISLWQSIISGLYHTRFLHWSSFFVFFVVVVFCFFLLLFLSLFFALVTQGVKLAKTH